MKKVCSNCGKAAGSDEKNFSKFAFFRAHAILFERLPEGALEGKIGRGAFPYSIQLTPMFVASLIAGAQGGV